MKIRAERARRGVTGLRSAVAAAAVLTAVAATPTTAAEGGEAGLVTALRANGAKIVPLGVRGGLEGYFVTPARGGGYGLYVTGDGHAVAGLLYGPDGTEITGGQLAATRGGTGPAVTAHAEIGGSGTASESSSGLALFERSAAAFGFTLGERGPVVVLLGDAACPWSRSAAARLGREALAGRLQLRVVPVAVLGAAAARRAVAIAAHPDPARAWFDGPDRAPDGVGAERIARNNALLDAWGASAVPLIAWRAPDGAVTRRVGDIDDVGAWLTDTLRVGVGP